MRAWTAFWAPLPSATMVMTAPTPMMMPSMVRSDRSLLARMAWSATWKISPRSTLGPRLDLRALTAPGRRLLLQAGQAAAGHGPHPVAHVALRVQERRARQHEHGVLVGQAAADLQVIEVGEPGADLDRCGRALAQYEHDVAGDVAAPSAGTAALAEAEPAAAGAAGAARAAGAAGATLELREDLPQGRALGRRQLPPGHPLLHRRTDLRLRDTGGQRDRAPVGHRHSVAGRSRCGRVALRLGPAERRAVAPSRRAGRRLRP